jgi:hypothetical protein
VNLTSEPQETETEAERQKRLEQRDFEMLKHISTLNVATLVLLLALVKDFSTNQIKTNPSFSTLLPLILFSVSLGCAIFGLFMHVTQGRDADWGVRISTVVAYGSFLLGLVVAIFVGYTTL